MRVRNAAGAATLEQRKAIEANDKQLVVQAGAGAGKTRVLVERFLRHVIEDKYGADEILTITFSRKAAAEMKRRIVTALRDAGRWEDAQIAETGPIQTIHSFCERLLRENSLVAGLDPQFEVLDEVDSVAWLEEALQESLVVNLEQRRIS